MPVDKLSPINQKLISNQTTAEKEVAKPVDDEPKKIDKKKLAIGIGAAVGISALVIGSIFYARRGKTNPKLQEGIKSFIDGNGNKIEGIKLEKGKAIASDGSMFSGIMETTTKSGKKISLEYKDGFVTQSNIDGKLFKKFENLSIPAEDGKPLEILSRNQGTRIIKYDNEGKFDGMLEHLYHDNGKIKRAVSETKATDFFPDGKIQALEVRNIWKQPNEDGFIPQTLSDYTEMLSAKLYDQEGKLTDDLIQVRYGDTKIIKYSQDGSKVELSDVGHVDQKIPPSTALVSEHNFDAPKAKFYDADGKLKEEIISRGQTFTIFGYEEGNKNACDKLTQMILEDDGAPRKIGVSTSSASEEWACNFSIHNGKGQISSYGNCPVEECIEYLKQSISNAKKAGVYRADKIYEQFLELLKKCK